MSENETRRYNLVFSGQLLPGTERSRAELTLAAFFGLRDAASVRGFFSGKPVPLRRNLGRDEALRLYRQLRSVGLICDLLRVRAEAAPGSKPPSRPRSSAPAAPQDARNVTRRRQADAVVLQIDNGRYLEDQARRTAADKVPATGRQHAPAATARAPAPNLFALRPGTVPGNPGSLAERLQARALVAGAGAAVLCVVVLAIALRFPAAPPGAEPKGPLAVASRPSGELLVLTEQALLMHARSGLARARLGAAEFGVRSFMPPLLALTDGRILIGGRLPEDDAPRLLRCTTVTRSCESYLTLGSDSLPVAVAESFLGDALFVYSALGKLARYDSDGGLQAERSLRAALDRPRLLYHQGLLLVPDPETPLLGVYRPDRENFAAQLDALFLASIDAPAATRLRDIAIVGDDHYALLADDAGNTSLLNFDTNWGARSAVDAATTPGTDAYLTVWRDRVLLADSTSGIMQRIAPGALFEAAFTSSLLREEREEWLRLSRQRLWLQSVGLTLPLLLALFAAAVALLYFAAAQVLRRESGARTALLDPMPAGISWTPPAPERGSSLRRARLLGLALTVIPAASLVAGERLAEALCLVPAILGALYAASALRRGRGGHFGRRKDEVVLVDYDGRYFYGRDKSVSRGAGFLFAGQVALPLNPAMLRNFKSPDVEGIRIDNDARGIIGRLWLLRHPWFAALLAVLGGWLASVALLLVS